MKMVGEDNELLQRFLSSFSCKQDTDIQMFLHERAVKFELLSKSCTYLVCDERELQEKPLVNVTIYGYISLALKTLYIPEKISNRMRKNLDGFSSKMYGKPISDITCYLIGQLGRNSNVSKTSLHGNELLQYAYDIIMTSVKSVGGRYIMIECKNEEKLIEFYKANGFTEISRSLDEYTVMIQMIRKI